MSSALRDLSNNTAAFSQGGVGGVAPLKRSSVVGRAPPPPPPPESSSSSPAPGANSPRADTAFAGDATYCTDLISDITERYLADEQRAVQLFNEGTAAHLSDTGSLYSYYASPHYLQYQPEVNEKMRMILIDWLLDVHIKFKLHPETLFLAVNLTDRYLSCVNTKHNPQKYVPRAQIQLVGITCTLIAAKYEEIWPPEIKDCVHIAANTYTREEIIKMERAICAALNFRLTVPTCLPFAMRLLTVLSGSSGALAQIVFATGSSAAVAAADLATLVRHATFFFLEHAALDYKCLQFTPSQTANASVALALLTLRLRYSGNDGNDGSGSGSVWTPLLQHYSKASAADIRGCAAAILDYVSFVPTTKYQAVRRKYSSSRYGEVAKMMMPSDLSGL